MIIISPGYGPIQLKKIDPENLQIPYLAGSDTFFCEKEFGTITLQEFRTENYSIRLGFFNLVKKISLIIKEDSSFLKGIFTMNGSFLIKRGHKPKLTLKKGQYIFCATDKTHSLLQFENEDQYQIFESTFSKNHLENFFEAFPSIKDYIENSRKSVVTSHIEKPRFISPEAKKIIHQLLHCPYDQNLRKLYFENKVNDLLFEILQQTFIREDHTYQTDQKEDEAIAHARDIILQDITKHYSIRDISKMVNLNKLKLKTGFKRVYGTGTFEYLLQARMDKAYDLIVNTDIPIKEIALETGFRHIANFITAFGRRFKKTPGEMRKK